MWDSNSQKGFTLLEILIAISLLAFITFGVVQITDDAVNTKERTVRINEDNLQIETALARMDWDITQTYSPLYFSSPMNFTANNNTGINPEDGISTQQNYVNMYREQLRNRFQVSQHFSAVSSEGIPVPRFYAPEKNFFEFFTSANRRKTQNSTQSHFAWVRYSLEDQVINTDEPRNEAIPSNVKNLVRYIANSDPWEDTRIDPENPDKVKKAVLLENVETLEFQFWDLDRRKWETSLRSIKNGENIIRGVKMKIVWYDESGVKRELTKVFRTHWPLVTPVQNQGTSTNSQGTGTGSATSGAGNGTTPGTTNGNGSGGLEDDN